MRGVILIPALALAACSGAPGPHAEAKALIAQRCAACHVVPGVRTATGRVGPSLAGVARRQVLAGYLPNSRDNMLRWIRTPQTVLPGNAMPNTGLTPEQAGKVADYLYSLDE